MQKKEKKGRKILIVEDEKPVAKALQLKFKSIGFETDVAYNGEEACDMLKKESYAVVVLDLIMPRLDGFGVLECMKKCGDKTPVVVSTNLGQEEDERRARSLGAADYFVKADTSIHDVIEHVKRVVGKDA